MRVRERSVRERHVTGIETLSEAERAVVLRAIGIFVELLGGVAQRFHVRLVIPDRSDQLLEGVQRLGVVCRATIGAEFVRARRLG